MTNTDSQRLKSLAVALTHEDDEEQIYEILCLAHGLGVLSGKEQAMERFAQLMAKSLPEGERERFVGILR